MIYFLLPQFSTFSLITKIKVILYVNRLDLGILLNWGGCGGGFLFTITAGLVTVGVRFLTL